MALTCSTSQECEREQAAAGGVHSRLSRYPVWAEASDSGDAQKETLPPRRSLCGRKAEIRLSKELEWKRLFCRHASVWMSLFHCSNNKIDILEAYVCILSKKLMMQLTFIFLFAVLRNSGKESKTSLTLNSSQEAEECAQEEREEAKEAREPLSNRALEAELRKQMAASLERCRAAAPSSSEAAVHNAGHKVGLLHILQQGWDLRSVWCLQL